MAGPQEVKTWLSTLTITQAKEYQAAGGTIHHCTCGPGDAMYLPACYVFHEHAVGDAVGVKKSVISSADFDVLSNLNNTCIAVKKPNKNLQDAVDAMSTM